MRTRKNDFDLVGSFLNIKYQAPDSLAGPMRLTHYLLGFWHKTLCPTVQANNQSAAFISHRRTAYDLPFSLNKLSKYTLSLIRSYLLDHYLFSCLSRNSAELLYINWLVVLNGTDIARGSVNMYDYLAVRLAKMLANRRDHSIFQIDKY